MRGRYGSLIARQELSRCGVADKGICTGGKLKGVFKVYSRLPLAPKDQTRGLKKFPLIESDYRLGGLITGNCPPMRATRAS